MCVKVDELSLSGLMAVWDALLLSTNSFLSTSYTQRYAPISWELSTPTKPKSLSSEMIGFPVIHAPTITTTFLYI